MSARMSPADAARLLGVPLDASLEDVQHAYLRAARQVHPDVLPGASEPERADAASRFDALSQAREVLFEHRPVVATAAAGPAPAFEGPAAAYAAAPMDYSRGRGLGGSLAVLALLVLLLIAIVSLQDAFRARTAGSLDGQNPPPVATSPP